MKRIIGSITFFLIVGISCKNETNIILQPTPLSFPLSRPVIILQDTSQTGNYHVSWHPIANASTYTLQEDTSASFASSTVDYVGPDTAVQESAKPLGHIYYYRVRAANSYGSGPWSDTVSILVSVSPSNVVFPNNNVSYSGQVQPLFNQACTASGCHDNGAHQSDLDLTDYGHAVLTVPGVVVPGKPDASTLVLRIEGAVGPRMPSAYFPLNQNQIGGIRVWVLEGAKDN